VPRYGFKHFNYGPTHVWASSRPGEPGRCVIAASRSDQIEFLQQMQAGDVLYLETADGGLKTYMVQDASIRHRRELRAQHPGVEDSLVLVARS
jgi:sortase (surface protein transpeptidase)